ncbi:hypothetical protein KA005_26625, partial [bacterium]|nr:hypothetical protein [bacterium]
ALGRLALVIEINSAGAIKLKHLTRNNLSTTTNMRYAAQIIEGQVYAAPEIVSIVGESFQIPANFTNIMINELAKRMEGKFEKAYTPSPYAITFTPLRILILLLILFTLILGLLPTTGLKESKHPRAWIAAGIVAGIVIGGYWFGVTSSGAVPDTQQPVWGRLIHISTMGVLSGSLIGGVLGIAGGYLLRFVFRRAIHNVYCLSKNVMEALLPVKATVIIKALQERKKRYLNKKQSVFLCSGVLLILFFIIFPPWIGSRTMIITEEYPEGYAGEDYEFIGFHFIFPGRDLSSGTLFITAKVDYKLLALLCCGTAVLSGLLMFLVQTPDIQSQRT